MKNAKIVNRFRTTMRKLTTRKATDQLINVSVEIPLR
jgi:hypothetical protein